MRLSAAIRTVLVWSVTIASGLTFAQTKTFIALGDSVTWGYQPNDTGRGPGDKGFVKLVADWLGTQQGGTRPTVINLAIPGESTASFYNTSEIGGLLNSNYPVFGRQSQANLFKSKVNSEVAAGHVITHVTFALGANDLLELMTQQYLSLPFEQQTAISDQALAAAAVNLQQQFALVRQYCPTAKLVIPGYYNPYGAFPGSAEDRISRYAIPRLNHILQVMGKRYRASFASTYEAFVGQELALTWIGEDDVHPRQPGYVVISQKVIGRIQVPLGSLSPEP